MPVNMRDPASGEVYVVDDDDVASRLHEGWQTESATENVERTTQARLDEKFGGVGGKIKAGLYAGARGATFGLSDVALDALDEGDEARKLREVNPGVSTVGEIAGSLIAPGAELGGVARVAEEGSALAKVSRAAATGIEQNALQGVGQAVSEAALSDDPLSVEEMGSSLLRNVGENVATGAGINLVGAGLGKSLRLAKGKLDDLAARTAARAEGDLGDLSKLDVAGLAKARKAELEAIDAQRAAAKTDLLAQRKAELERIDAANVGEKKALGAAREGELGALEAERVQARAQIADEIKAHRATAKDEKLFLATKDAKTWEGVDEGLKKEVREVGKLSLEADKAIDRNLRNPKALASNPRRALDALQQQESALETLLNRRADLEQVFAADASKARVQALDAAERALQRNRDLQARIVDAYKPAASSKLDEIAGQLDQLGARGRASTKLDEIQASLDELRGARTSPRLEQIEAARDALAGTSESFGSKIASGAAYSLGSSLVGSIPLIGGFLAPFAGAASANAITGKLTGKLAEATAAAAKRASTAIDKFLAVGEKVAPVAPVLGTKVLNAVRYSLDDDEKPARTPASKKEPRLAQAFRARTDELKRQVTYEAGVPKLRPAARAQIAKRLAPIAATQPVLADRLETLEARKREYLARAIPRRPDVGGIQTGPDLWQPSEFDMRSFAAKVAAAEDPHAVLDRLTDGTITPEDAEAFRAVYPELFAQVTQEILGRLGELRATLPYQRRLALSLFTGIAVDPAMDPRILTQLQGSFAREANTAGGTEAPRAKPAFGSVKAHELTPAQRRQEGTTV